MENRVQRYAVPFFVVTMRQPLLMLLLLPLLPKQALIYKCFYFSKLLILNCGARHRRSSPMMSAMVDRLSKK